MDSRSLEIIRVLFPMPDVEEVGEGAPFYDQAEWTARRQVEVEQELVEVKERCDGGSPRFDPLLYKLKRLADERSRLDTQIRDLIVYARNFVGPRPYALAALAEHSGMSLSGVRLISQDAGRMERIAQSIGKPDNSGRMHPVDRQDIEMTVSDGLAEFRKARDTPR